MNHVDLILLADVNVSDLAQELSKNNFAHWRLLEGATVRNGDLGSVQTLVPSRGSAHVKVTPVSTLPMQTLQLKFSDDQGPSCFPSPHVTLCNMDLTYTPSWDPSRDQSHATESLRKNYRTKALERCFSLMNARVEGGSVVGVGNTFAVPRNILDLYHDVCNVEDVDARSRNATYCFDQSLENSNNDYFVRDDEDDGIVPRRSSRITRCFVSNNVRAVKLTVLRAVSLSRNCYPACQFPVLVEFP